MNFEAVNNSVINKVLTPNAGSNFRVQSGQIPGLSAEEILNSARLVSVHTSSLDFTGRETGPVQNSGVIYLDLFVSADAKADLTVLQNEAATPEQRAAALAGRQSAAYRADISMNTLIGLVWNIVMSARYDQLALDEAVGAFPVDTEIINGSPKQIKIAERKLTRVDKDQIVEMGEFVVLTARMTLTYKVSEQVSGLTPVTMTEGIQDGWQFADTNGTNLDTTSKTGVTTP